MNNKKVQISVARNALNEIGTFSKIIQMVAGIAFLLALNICEAKEKIVFSCSVSAKLPMFKIAEENFKRAFNAMGYDFELVEAANGKRGLIDVVSGIYDGDCARSGELNEWVPNSHLIRVNVKLTTSYLGAWTADPNITVNSVDDLKQQRLRLGNLKGILASDNFFAENKLIPTLEANNLGTAIKLLRSNRVDVFISPVESMKERLAQEANVSNIHLVANLKSYEIYPFIHEKHKALASQLEWQLKNSTPNKVSN